MKKTLFVCLLAFVFCGCFEVHDDTSNHEIDRIPAKYIGSTTTPKCTYKFYIVEIDGDEYIIMDGVECAGICAYEARRKKKGI